MTSPSRGFAQLVIASLLCLSPVYSFANDAPPTRVRNTNEARVPSDKLMLASESDAAPAQEHSARARARIESLFARFDKDNDGKIALKDLPERLRERLSKADANNDGLVTREELNKAWEQRAAEIKMKMDINGDGVISDQERAAARSQFWDKRFAKLDKNHDGALSSDEVPPMMWDRIRVADANNDGKVTRAEVDQAILSGKLPSRHQTERKHTNT